jgi:DNA polymerase-3 subunit epsilon
VIDKLKLTKPICFFDVETTGLDVKKERIVEIAILKITNTGREQYTTYINPGISIPEQATKVHGITDDLVEDAPTLKEAWPKILAFIGDCVLAGYNIITYDVPLLFWELDRHNIEFDYWKYPLLDIKTLHEKLNRRDLASIYQLYTNKTLENAHVAMTDVKATVEIFEEQCKKYELPNDLNELVSLSQWGTRLDLSNKFVIKDGETYYNFGVNKGVLARDDKKYLTWMLSSDFTQDVKIIVKNILNGNIK